MWTKNEAEFSKIKGYGKSSLANIKIGLMWCTFSEELFIVIIIIIRMFYPRAGPSLQAQETRLQFFRRQVFNRKLGNQGCSFTRDWIGAVAPRCFPHLTLSLASEQTLKDLKRSQGHQRGGEDVDLAKWALRTSPKFTTGVKYHFHHRIFDQVRDPEIPITLRPTI